jgi:hypothetical protein
VDGVNLSIQAGEIYKWFGRGCKTTTPPAVRGFAPTPPQGPPLAEIAGLITMPEAARAQIDTHVAVFTSMT